MNGILESKNDKNEEKRIRVENKMLCKIRRSEYPEICKIRHSDISKHIK